VPNFWTWIFFILAATSTLQIYLFILSDLRTCNFLKIILATTSTLQIYLFISTRFVDIAVFALNLVIFNHPPTLVILIIPLPTLPIYLLIHSSTYKNL
jgi:hypothetical protein